MYKIGVFDSGMGGLSVARAVKEALPDCEVVFRNDAANLPYGNKTPQQLLGFVLPILEQMVADECDVIIIACNSVTTTIIHDLRKRITVPLIGMEPMIKPAAKLTETGMIAVCATPLTLSSKRYASLKKQFAKNIIILEPDCHDWAFMIETKQIDRHKIVTRIDEACKMGADVIVLGCTHYHWIEELIKEAAHGRAEVLQPEEPVIAQLKRVLSTLVPAPRS